MREQNSGINDLPPQQTDSVFYRTHSSLNLQDVEQTSVSNSALQQATPSFLGRLALLKNDFTRKHFIAFAAATAIVLMIIWWVGISVESTSSANTLSTEGAITLSVFAMAVWFWIFTNIDDTYVALGAAILLVIMGVLPEKALFDTLGDDTVWLLLGAFVIAAGITASGLATRAAAFIVTGAKNARQLMHLSSAALVATAFAVPSTSGRAALAMPVFVALASVLRNRPTLVLSLALLFPSVILLSAVGSYLGAGAHLITSQILAASNFPSFSFTNWMLYGLPLAVAASIICVELILMLFTSKTDRTMQLSISANDLQSHTSIPIKGKLTPAQVKVSWLVGIVIVMWCMEPVHGIHPAVIALAGGLVMSSNSLGVVSLGKALKSVPWSLLIFMAATLAMGSALVTSGSASWAAGNMLGSIKSTGATAAVFFTVTIVLISTVAHLVIQSRSARSAVLIPIVVSLAPEVGVSAVAAAFASTAAAGFCHTLSSSAKPMALYAKLEDMPTYSAKDLLRLSAWLAPISVILVLLFTFFIWPMMGMPLFVKP